MFVNPMAVSATLVDNRNVDQQLREGVVFTLTQGIDARRPAGAHFVSLGMSSSGFCVKFHNTFTGRDDQLMADGDHLLARVRVLGFRDQDAEVGQ